jgi:hypothetical protein
LGSPFLGLATIRILLTHHFVKVLEFTETMIHQQ